LALRCSRSLWNSQAASGVLRRCDLRFEPKKKSVTIRPPTASRGARGPSGCPSEDSFRGFAPSWYSLRRRTVASGRECVCYAAAVGVSTEPGGSSGPADLRK
jgi:hypothetical protein